MYSHSLRGSCVSGGDLQLYQEPPCWSHEAGVGKDQAAPTVRPVCKLLNSAGVHFKALGVPPRSAGSLVSWATAGGPVGPSALTRCLPSEPE